MKSFLTVPVVVAIVLSSTATFFITKSITSNSESQVVAYLREKEAERKAESERQMEIQRIANKQAAEAARKALERRYTSGSN